MKNSVLTPLAFLLMTASPAVGLDASDLDAYIENNGGRGARSGYDSEGPALEEQFKEDFKREINERLERVAPDNCAHMNAIGGAAAEMDCRRSYHWD